MIYKRVLSFSLTCPDKIAISRHGRNLSYRAFAELIRAAQFAFLKCEVTGSGIIVLAITDIQVFWIYSLALRGLGVTTTAISCASDIEIIANHSVKAVVRVSHESWPGLDETCVAAGVPLISMPDTSEYCACEHDLPPMPDAGGHLLFTSGTTGSPKLVLWNSRAEEGALKWATEFDSATLYHVFDFGPWTAAGYFVPLAVWAHGGGIIIHQLPERHAALRHPHGTHAILLPYFLGEILAAPEGEFPRNESLKLYLGGGTVTAAQLSEAKRRITPHIFNRLASTEVGGIACTPFDEPDDQRWHRIASERGIEIVDEHDCVLPCGKLGQLRVPVGSGPSGYYNDPETSRAFFRDGYFYPGDLAIARKDGRIALQGRVTEVINVAGMKVAPAPYEDYLRQRFGLSGICLFSEQDDYGEEQVYSVVETVEPLASHLIHSLEQQAFTNLQLKVRTVSALPRTGTGKVIRDRVRALVLATENRATQA